MQAGIRTLLQQDRTERSAWEETRARVIELTARAQEESDVPAR
jgi:hypothetical protein